VPNPYPPADVQHVGAAFLGQRNFCEVAEIRERAEREIQPLATWRLAMRRLLAASPSLDGGPRSLRNMLTTANSSRFSPEEY